MSDLISRQAAIDAIDEISREVDDGYGFDYAKWRQYFCELPSEHGTNLAEVGTDMISRQAACEYCHEDSDGYVRPLEKNCHAFIRFGMDGWELSLQAKGWHGSAKIKYCPICGRRLTDG